MVTAAESVALLKKKVKALQRVIAKKDVEIETLRHNVRIRCSESEAAFICCGSRFNIGGGYGREASRVLGDDAS